jgi:hypothetical protein
MTAVDATVYEPISLGYGCEVKYQLSRVLFARKFPDGNADDLRRMLMTPEYGQRTFERHIFDWQITPFTTVLEYLESDFQGVFEREDLYVDDGVVTHRRLGTRHPHDFHPVDGVLDAAAIDAGYAAARSKFEHLATKFRALLLRPGPYLYVHKQIRIHSEAVRLMELLRVHNPDHAFKILFVGGDDEDQMLAALEGEVFKAWTPMQPDKPAERAWEGDDARWDDILEPWRLGLHGGDRITRTFDESLEGQDQDDAGEAGSASEIAASSWTNRLRGWLTRRSA